MIWQGEGSTRLKSGKVNPLVFTVLDALSCFRSHMSPLHVTDLLHKIPRIVFACKSLPNRSSLVIHSTSFLCSNVSLKGRAEVESGFKK